MGSFVRSQQLVCLLEARSTQPTIYLRCFKLETTHPTFARSQERKRENTQDLLARIYHRSRIARTRRLAQYAEIEGDFLDHNGDFVDDCESNSFAGFSIAGSNSSVSSTHTQRTDAL